MKIKLKKKKRVRLTGTPGSAGGDFDARILEDVDVRITESGDTRILE